MDEKEKSLTIQFVKTGFLPPTGFKTTMDGTPVPKHYLWSQLVTSVANQRYYQAVDLITKDLEASRKVIAISDRKNVLRKLLEKFHNSPFKVSLLQGDCGTTERQYILEGIKRNHLDLLLTTKMLECWAEMQGCNIVKDPLSQHFDTVHILTPTVAAFERRCMLPEPLRMHRLGGKQRVASKTPTLVRYYVDDNDWLRACAFKNKKVAKKNGWQIDD